MAEQEAARKRLEQNLLTISLEDFAASQKMSAEDFTLVGVEHSESECVWSGGELPPIQHLEKNARAKFLKKLPPEAIAVVSLKKIVEETPSGFSSHGHQFVSYLGTALVPKR